MYVWLIQKSAGRASEKWNCLCNSLLCLPLLSASRWQQPNSHSGRGIAKLPRACSTEPIIVTVNCFLQVFPRF